MIRWKVRRAIGWATSGRRGLAMPWVYDDGGRAAAGYHGAAGDCVVRAVAIGTGKPYREIYDWFAREMRDNPHLTDGEASIPCKGVPPVLTRAYLSEHGWEWTPTMGIGTGCRYHLTPFEIPMRGTVICRLSLHVAAVIDGVVYDTHDPSREGTRCVYGYWRPA